MTLKILCADLTASLAFGMTPREFPAPIAVIKRINYAK